MYESHRQPTIRVGFASGEAQALGSISSKISPPYPGVSANRTVVGSEPRNPEWGSRKVLELRDGTESCNKK